MRIKKIQFAFIIIVTILLAIVPILLNAIEVEEYVPITPNGTVVPYQTINQEMSLSDIQKYITNEQQYINKGAIKLDEPTNKYNSHSYAWYNQNNDVNNKIISNEDVKKYFQDNSYCFSNGAVGDIICYWRVRLEYENSNKEVLKRATPYLAHSGIITSINGYFNPDDLTTLKNITIISKWGNGGLYEHTGDNNPYYYDSIHGSSRQLDLLHFDYIGSNTMDDALFYVKVYTPKTHKIMDINFSIHPTIEEHTFSQKEYQLYKLNIINSGNFNFKTEANNLVDIKLFDKQMNLIYDNEIIMSSTLSYINASLDSGMYYLRIAFKDSKADGIIKTFIERVVNQEDLENGILVDYQQSGSEVFLNNGIKGNTTITEGFTRYLYLNPEIAPSISRLDYDWYSSDSSKAIVTPYGTILAKNGQGNPEVTITAVYKNDKTIVFRKAFTIMKELKSYNSDPININSSMMIEKGVGTLIILPENVPYNYNQYYNWSTNNASVNVSTFGTIKASVTGTFAVTGVYKYNSRVRVTIVVTII